MKSDGRRVARVEREVQETLAKFLSGRTTLSAGTLLTVSKVMMSGDLRSAKVYISVLAPAENSPRPQDVIDSLQKHAFEMQDDLSHSLKLRFCPKLKFFLDETTEKILQIEKIIDNLSEQDADSNPMKTMITTSSGNQKKILKSKKL
jgi:ribosome-binding factor A